MFLVGTIPPRDSGREFGPLFWAGIPPGGLIDGRSHGVVDRSLCGGRITWAPPPGVHRLLRRAPGKAPRRCGGDPRNAACVEGWKDVGDGGPDCLPICNRPTKRTACSVREDGPRGVTRSPPSFPPFCLVREERGAHWRRDFVAHGWSRFRFVCFPP